MINDKIENLREKLNELIANGAEYEEIYNEYPSDLELYSYSLPAAAGFGWREDKND